MLPAQSCLDYEGWRKSRLQIIRTNNYCEPVLEGWQVFIIAAKHLSRKFNQAWTSCCIIRLGTWLWTCFCQYSIFYRDTVKFNFLRQISSQKPSTNIQIFKNYFDKTTCPAYQLFVHFQFYKWLELSKGGQYCKKFRLELNDMNLSGTKRVMTFRFSSLQILRLLF